MNTIVYYEGRDLEILAEMPRYYGWIMRFFQPYLRGRALEVGAGAGAISSRILPLVESLDLVEPSPNLVERLRSRFDANPNVRILPSTLEGFLDQEETELFDCAVLVNVLEHIENDGEALSGLYARLKPGGHLLLFVPALPWLYSPLDKLVGHFRRYESAGMNSLLANAGFEQIDSRYMDALGILPWWFIFVVAGQTSFHQGGTHFYDRFGIPISRVVDRLLGNALGKNIVAVARKPV